MQHQHSFEQPWRILSLTICEQQIHIERSEQLLAETAPGATPVLYWSQAEPAGVVLGFSQKSSLLNAHALAERHLPVYHRRAGGTAVLVGPHVLALDVVLPATHRLVLPDVVEAYRWFGETWVRALDLLGVKARIVLPAEAHAQRALVKQEAYYARESVLRRACYASNSPYEVVVGERKLVGLDMIRRRQGSLLQAGILLHWESETLAHLLGHTPEEQALLRRELPKRAIGLDELGSQTTTVHEIMQAFEAALAKA